MFLIHKKFLVLGQDSKKHLLPNILKEETDIMEIVEPYQNTSISLSISHLKYINIIDVYEWVEH